VNADLRAAQLSIGATGRVEGQAAVHRARHHRHDPLETSARPRTEGRFSRSVWSVSAR
jgi:hypothetical protein